MQRYEVAVLGGGPGGEAAARRAAWRGARVCLIESAHLGGACLHVGCIPTKTMLHASGLFRSAKDARRFGLSADGLRIDGEAFMRHAGGVVGSLAKGVAQAIEAAGVEGSEYAVEEARRRAGIELICADLGKALPFHQHSFANVVINETIEHLKPDAAQLCLHEAFRVLRPSGMLLINSPSRWNREEKNEPTHVNLYWPCRLRTEALAAGFTRYRATDSPQPPNLKLLSPITRFLFRRLKWQRLSATANCVAYRPDREAENAHITRRGRP